MLVSIFLAVTNIITSSSAGFVLGIVLCLYLWKILVRAVAAFAVNFLTASRDVDFKWYATWNVFLGAAFGVDFLAAAGAAAAVLDFFVHRTLLIERTLCVMIILVLVVILGWCRWCWFCCS